MTKLLLDLSLINSAVIKYGFHRLARKIKLVSRIVLEDTYMFSKSSFPFPLRQTVKQSFPLCFIPFEHKMQPYKYHNGSHSYNTHTLKDNVFIIIYYITTNHTHTLSIYINIHGMQRCNLNMQTHPVEWVACSTTPVKSILFAITCRFLGYYGDLACTIDQGFKDVGSFLTGDQCLQRVLHIFTVPMGSSTFLPSI